MRKGFTLIELMIVIAIIAIIAAIAIPNLLESRVTANEAAAATSLKSGIFAAEVQFQGGAYQDGDSDNVGEYGHLQHLTGARATTSQAALAIKLVNGPLASGTNATALTAAGTLEANGYKYAAFVPNVDSTAILQEGAAVVGTTTGGTSHDGACERYYMVGAAPVKTNDTGRRIFLISHEGQVRSPTLNTDVAVWTSGGSATAATLASGAADAVTGGVNLASGFASGYPFYSK